MDRHDLVNFLVGSSVCIGASITSLSIVKLMMFDFYYGLYLIPIIGGFGIWALTPEDK